MAQVYTGIDIGSHQVKVVIAAPPETHDQPMQILGTGAAMSRGMRHGYITDINEAVACIDEALERARVAAKVKPGRVRVGVGGIGLDEIRSQATISLTASGSVVTQKDLERVIEEAEKRSAQKLINKNVLHAIPLEYRVDGQRVLGKALGLQGTSLSVDALLVTMLSQHHDDIVRAVESAGGEVEGVMASPIAASLVTLTKSQKNAGVVLANVGAETLSVVVYENDIPVSIKVFQVGSSDVTHSLALAFKISLSDAEQLKRGSMSGLDISEKKIQTVLGAQLKTMWGHVGAHLKSINRFKLLPSGIIITGGGAGLMGATDSARALLQLPAQVGAFGAPSRAGQIDAAWSVAYGLCRWAYTEDLTGTSSNFGNMLSDMWSNMKSTFRSFLP